GDWRRFLPRSRDQTVAFLHSLKKGPDLARVGGAGGEPWSIRKVLRRLVRHELLHCKSVQRIVSAWRSPPSGP
ncbi:MAG: hypothetical protein ACE5JG_11180, partial [Planctomycetota bacterium]